MMHTIQATVQGLTIETWRDRITEPEAWGDITADRAPVITLMVDGHALTVWFLADKYGTPFVIEASDIVHGKLPPVVVTSTDGDDIDVRILTAGDAA